MITGPDEAMAILRRENRRRTLADPPLVALTFLALHLVVSVFRIAVFRAPWRLSLLSLDATEIVAGLTLLVGWGVVMHRSIRHVDALRPGRVAEIRREGIIVDADGESRLFRVNHVRSPEVAVNDPVWIPSPVVLYRSNPVVMAAPDDKGRHVLWADGVTTYGHSGEGE